MSNINILSNGGAGDFILSKRLSDLLNKFNPDNQITNYFCSRNETFNMIKVLYPNEVNDNQIKQLDEDFLKSIKNEEDLKNFDISASNYIVYPDKLFRGLGAPPLKELGLTNFVVKQHRTLLGRWKPDNYISLAINSITAGYTYHSVAELAIKLALQHPDKQIYLPLLTTWNGKDVPMFNFPNPPDNLIFDIQPEFSKVYDILCKSEYCICTDNAMMHICHDLGLPYLTLDPQYLKPAFEARWRPNGYNNSIAISALVEDVLEIVKVQLDIPETQMLEAINIYRKPEENWKEILMFKE